MKTMFRILVELLAVTVLGSALALAANQASGKGLSIDRNYFPNLSAGLRPATGQTDNAARPAENGKQAVSSPDTAAANTAGPPVDDHVLRQLLELGLQAVSHDEAEAAFKDPLYSSQIIIFVDARNDEHYRDGHIPGAWQFDRYRPEKYVAEVMSAAQSAMKVIVYCGGGECEDSKYAAVELREAGLDPAKTFVYPGGVKEWTQRGMPLEKGVRGSGVMVSPK